MDFEKIGRARVMVRLPRYRKQLSDLDFLALSSLLEAYGVAVTALKVSKIMRSLSTLWSPSTPVNARRLKKKLQCCSIAEAVASSGDKSDDPT